MTTLTKLADTKTTTKSVDSPRSIGSTGTTTRSGSRQRRSRTPARVRAEEGEAPLIYIDRQLVHEVTSPQAFSGLRVAGRKVRQLNKTLATMDHNVSTQSLAIDAAGPMAKIQMQTLQKNCFIDRTSIQASPFRETIYEKAVHLYKSENIAVKRAAIALLLFLGPPMFSQ